LSKRSAIFVLIFAGGLIDVGESLKFAKYLAGFGFILFAVATILTIWSGISYVVKNKQVLTQGGM
jgi:phosphatidylglycerophosphate synthase